MQDEQLLWLMASHPEKIEQQLTNLGKRIRQLRKAKGYRNYEQFAFQHNINRSSYSRFENGEDMRFSSLLKVLEALDINLQDFFSEGFDQNETEEKTKNE